jgi:predicted dehydrogenase
MNLSPEEKKTGKENFDEAVGTTRRDFLKGTVLAAGTASVALGAMYFGYEARIDRRLRVGIIGTGDEGGVLIGGLNPEFIDVRAIADIRPYSIHRAFHGDAYSPDALAARPGLMQVYGWRTEDEARQHVKVYGRYQDLLDDADLDIEAVIIALPLHVHDAAAIHAMRKGKHVLTEKLMAHSTRQCKEMARVAAATGLILATGHQRHYNIQYDNAVDQIRQGLIGHIHHIRAQWHRGNLPGRDSWQPPMPEPIGGLRDFERALAALGSDAAARAALAEAHPLYSQLRSWRGRLKQARGVEIDLWQKRVAQTEAQLRDIEVNAEDFGYAAKTLPGGYQRSALEELIRWRLWERTGGGLMAELGSHQLDAAGIFISAQRADERKVKPLSVVGVGGRSIFPADRECDDHVYCMFEFPAAGYFKEDDRSVVRGSPDPAHVARSGDRPQPEVADPNKKTVVSYSSINGNGFGGYGEIVFGTDGTLILEREQDAMLFKGSSTTTRIEVRQTTSGPIMDTYETGGGAAVAQAAIPTNISRGYREETEHWAWCIRNPGNKPRCTPDVALADAVIALVSNIAIAEQRRIEFQPEWFDIQSDATPEGDSPRPTAELA